MSRQSEIEAVLNSLSKEELIHIIIPITVQDEVLRDSLLVKFSNGDPAKRIQS